MGFPVFASRKTSRANRHAAFFAGKKLRRKSHACRVTVRTDPTSTYPHLPRSANRRLSCRSRGRLGRPPFASRPLTTGEEASMYKPQMRSPRVLVTAFAVAGLLGCDGLTSPSSSSTRTVSFSVSTAEVIVAAANTNRAMFATADAPLVIGVGNDTYGLIVFAWFWLRYLLAGRRTPPAGPLGTTTPAILRARASTPVRSS